MVDGLRILSPDLARNADVPALGGTNRALQALARDGQSNPLTVLDGSVFDRTKQRGLLELGNGRKVTRTSHLSPDGVSRTGTSQLVFYDAFDVNQPTIDVQKWVVTNSGMTITLSALNHPQEAVASAINGAGTTNSAAAGSMLVSHRFFPYVGRNTLLFRARVLHSPHFPDTSFEHGFGSPTSAAGTAALNAVNGAHWRKNRIGNYVPVVAINGVEFEGPAGSSVITQAQLIQFVQVNTFFYLEVSLSELCAVFRMQTHDGQTISEQTIFFSTLLVVGGLQQGAGTFSKSHVQVFHRGYTNGAIQTTTLPVLAMIASTSVYLLDNVGPSYRTNQTQFGAGGLISPASGGSITQGAQLANASNLNAPTGISVSNTSATYTNLGGQWSWVLPATGAETDVLAFNFQNAATWTFICTGIRISGCLTAVGTLPAILQWGFGFNGTAAASLATGGHMRKTLGTQAWPTGSGIGTAVPDIVWEGQEPLLPGSFNAIIVKGIVSNTNTVRGAISIDGYFE